jgi:hypothetical protein
MAVRPDSNLEHALIVTLIVETAQTVAVGRVVKDGNADKECQHATAVGDEGIGVVVAIGGNPAVTPGTAGDKVQVALLSGACIIPVKVGTGGATRGVMQQVVADGVTDVTPNAAGATYTRVYGWPTQNGVAGDIIGMVPARGLVIET